MKKVSNDKKASLKVTWTATVFVITPILVPALWYRKLKCPLRVGPCARIARGILSAKGTTHLFSSERSFWWAFNLLLLSGFATEPVQKAACLLLMLYKRGLPSPALGQVTWAYADSDGAAS